VLATRPTSALFEVFAAGIVVHAAGAAEDAVRCAASLPSTSEWQYKVRGRVRPLLIWTGRHEVGEARLKRGQSSGGDQSLELLIGTDPERAPMHLNRWGYVAEATCGPAAHMLGLMTQSDEERLDDAVNLDGQSGGRPFKAIRTTLVDGVATTELFRMAPADNPSYKQVDALLARLPETRGGRRLAVPTGAEFGFLHAIAGVIHDSADSYRRNGRAPMQKRRYVYSSTVYDLTAKFSPLNTLAVNGRTYASVLEGSFEVRNPTTGDVTAFRVAFDPRSADAEIPLRVLYQPRWWLEIELSLEADGTKK
jgi:hypothetical protein